MYVNYMRLQVTFVNKCLTTIFASKLAIHATFKFQMCVQSTFALVLATTLVWTEEFIILTRMET